jgi:hypothetical protein
MKRLITAAWLLLLQSLGADVSMSCFTKVGPYGDTSGEEVTDLVHLEVPTEMLMDHKLARINYCYEDLGNGREGRILTIQAVLKVAYGFSWTEPEIVLNEYGSTANYNYACSVWDIDTTTENFNEMQVSYDLTMQYPVTQVRFSTDAGSWMYAGVRSSSTQPSQSIKFNDSTHRFVGFDVHETDGYIAAIGALVYDATCNP